jgi:hypothetical protein
MAEMKYQHEVLTEAIEELQEFGGFQKEVDASRKAGEILQKAIDNFKRSLEEDIEDLSDLDEEEKKRYLEVDREKNKFKGNTFSLG